MSGNMSVVIEIATLVITASVATYLFAQTMLTVSRINEYNFNADRSRKDK